MMERAGETLDSIIYPDLRIIQKANGYRFALDPILLSAFLPGPPGGPIIDLGCGSGIISLLLARRWREAILVGLEIQEDLAEMARRSVRLNALEGRVDIVRGDLRRGADPFAPGSFGAVIANPPYRKLGSGRLCPDPQRAGARHELFMSLDDLLAATGHLLRPRGRFVFSWKPERLGEMEERLPAHGLGLEAVRPVVSRPGEEPFLLLCRGGRGGRGRRRLLPALAVRGESGYSPEMDHLLRTGSYPASQSS